ncbi:hypothetical protein MettiDRAFT_1253 [Methanolobus tindarius DSM 2278]|uniref:Apea-like HEPN domain-containing protein n=1 Tax=Methanolobus tindarius DSM 2278 TaxID=1090322 RepID=W9DQM6_METTI|nr:hypothetical protein MettiDRAFT_1253 [Methanolobus tindarius DSM 2278]
MIKLSEDERAYLDFERIRNEHIDFYKDYTSFDDFNDKKKECFFTDNLKIFSQYIYLINSLRNENIIDMKINYSLFGMAYEFLLKICALKINWDEYFESYKTNHRNRNYNYVKEYVLADLDNKLSSEQYQRSEEIMTFVQLQRNHFVHNLFKGMDHYAIPKQMYELIAVLVVIYKLSLPKEVVAYIQNGINNNSFSHGMDFKEVGFEVYTDKLSDYALDIPLFNDYW